MAGSASGFICTNHCFETSGSTTVLQRWQRPTGVAVGLDAVDEPERLQVLDDALPGLEAVEPRVLARRARSSSRRSR